MAFIYNLFDTWSNPGIAYDAIKMSVTNTQSASMSNLIKLTVSGATTASFIVDKYGNGSVSNTFAIGGATIGSNALAIIGTSAFTGDLTLGAAGAVRSSLVLANTSANSVTLQSSNSTSTPWTLTLPTTAGTNNYVLATDGAGNTSWVAQTGGGGGSGTVTSVSQTFTGGLISVSGSPITTSGTLALSVAGTSGGVPYFNSSSSWASSAVLTANYLMVGGGAGVAPATTTTGSGVLTALGTNVGTDGAFVVKGGALGTPSSGTLTNATGLPISTGVSGLGANVATFLATPSSANLASAVTDETGTGKLVFSNSPTFDDDITLGVASSATGVVKFTGTTSGIVSLSVADTAGTWTMKLPTSAGTNGYYLQTDGAGNTSWVAAGGTGDVAGPASSTDNAVVRFDGTTGKLIQNSAVTIADTTGNITGGTYNKVTITAPATGSTLTIADGKTLTTNNTLTFTGTDSSSVAFGSGGTVAYTGGTLAQFAATTSSQLAGVISDETGSGSLVFATSPTLVTPVLGTPTSGTLTNCTGYPVGNLSGLGTGVATFLATPSSANLAAAVTDETGSGALVFATSPSLTTPTLGVASATTINKVTITAPATGSTLTIADGKTLTASNTLTFTGTDASSVAFGTGGTVAYTGGTLAQFASTTSSQLAGVISDETGSGSLVFATSPSLTTPSLGVASATSVNKVAITAPATGSTLTIADGKTLTASNTLTLAGTDSTTMTFPGTSSTVLTTGNTATITKGYTVTPYSVGTQSSGTLTPDPANGNYQYVTNGGAFTLAAPSSDCAIDLYVINGASGAGAITLSGFKTAGANVGGNTYATTANTWWVFSIRRTNGVSTYNWSGPWT